MILKFAPCPEQDPDSVKGECQIGYTLSDRVRSNGGLELFSRFSLLVLFRSLNPKSLYLSGAANTLVHTLIHTDDFSSAEGLSGLDPLRP
jgi:hypothetical protein